MPIAEFRVRCNAVRKSRKQEKERENERKGVEVEADSVKHKCIWSFNGRQDVEDVCGRSCESRE